MWVAGKLNFRLYIRRYTSPNENFEYNYPLNEPQNQYSIRLREECSGWVVGCCTWDPEVAGSSLTRGILLSPCPDMAEKMFTGM